MTLRGTPLGVNCSIFTCKRAGLPYTLRAFVNKVPNGGKIFHLGPTPATLRVSASVVPRWRAQHLVRPTAENTREEERKMATDSSASGPHHAMHCTPPSSAFFLQPLEPPWPRPTDSSIFHASFSFSVPC